MYRSAIVLAAILLMPLAGNAKDTLPKRYGSPIFKMIAGEGFPVCREMAQLLAAPENHDYLLSKKTSEITIPRQWRNLYGKPVWKDISKEEAREYFKESPGYGETTLEEFLARGKFQESVIDYNNNG